MSTVWGGWSQSFSVAPNAGQDKASRSDFPHFAIQLARRENAENADVSLVSHPDPPTLAFLERKQGKPRKRQGFFSPRNPEKKGKRTQKKQGKSENEKKQGNRKKQGLEGRGKNRALRKSAAQ